MTEGSKYGNVTSAVAPFFFFRDLHATSKLYVLRRMGKVMLELCKYSILLLFLYGSLFSFIVFISSDLQLFIYLLGI